MERDYANAEAAKQQAEAKALLEEAKALKEKLANQPTKIVEVVKEVKVVKEVVKEVEKVVEKEVVKPPSPKPEIKEPEVESKQEIEDTPEEEVDGGQAEPEPEEVLVRMRRIKVTCAWGFLVYMGLYLLSSLLQQIIYWLQCVEIYS